jgi:hypothetical protein
LANATGYFLSDFFVLLAKGVKTCWKDHTAFKDADNDVEVPPGVREVKFDHGIAGATSEYNSAYSKYTPASKAFTRKRGYDSRLISE